MTKLSLAKRFFLAGWMMLFVLDIPIFYQYFPGLFFGLACVVALGVYVTVLFSSELSFGKKKKKFSSLQGQTMVISQPVKKSRSDKARASKEESKSPKRAQSQAATPKPKVQEPVLTIKEQKVTLPSFEETLSEVSVQSETLARLEASRQSETQEIDHLVQDTLQQIDALFSKESQEVAAVKPEPQAKAAVVEPVESPAPTSSYEEELAKVSLEDLFFESKSSAEPVQEAMAESLAEEPDALRQEIEEILDQHTADKAPTSPSPLAEQEDPQNTQEERGFYFQFLMYESKELAAMGDYQEAVDYLKEILVESEDRELRIQALELLETIYTTLYQPKLKESAL
nr:hypothetical protein [Streptococcus oricebi]